MHFFLIKVFVLIIRICLKNLKKTPATTLQDINTFAAKRDCSRIYCSLPNATTVEIYACLTADPGVASLIPVRSHTFVEIDHEIISTVILLPSADLF